MKKIGHAISSSGLCSRRHAEGLVLSGKVSVNGSIILSCASRVDNSDEIKVDGKLLKTQNPKIILFHKPIKCLTSHKSQNGYRTIFDLIKNKSYLTFLGRLDYMSEGLVVLTNDTSLVSKFSSEKYERIYEIFTDSISHDFINCLKKPVLDNFVLKPIRLISKKKIVGCYKLVLALRQGVNREIRKLCNVYGMSVLKLKKIQHGPFKLENLKPCESKELENIY
ncbi:MAG: rRNA pseudouridine synthase [Alphaproteobacteria bacterium]|nr:MAG: rRNA pseudouridine synthase [Alphaproteobacteria bacterium]